MSRVRFLLLALLSGVIVAAAAPTAQAAFGVQKFFAGLCYQPEKSKCESSSPATAFYTQAAGHPPYGVTGFSFNYHLVKGFGGKSVPKPDGEVENIRVDLPPGLSINPQAVPQCSEALLANQSKSEEEEKKLNECLVGEDELTVLVAEKVKTTQTASVYNIVPRNGVPAQFGFTVPVFSQELTYLIGGVSWNTDYHEYFNINKVFHLPKGVELLGSRLIFKGNVVAPGGTGAFITTPSTCNGPQITGLKIESYEGESASAQFSTAPLEGTGCTFVPFVPTLSVTPETTQLDQPDGLSAELKVPHDSSPHHVDSSTLKTAVLALPEGLTMNPSAAAGLEGCTEEQIGIHSTSPMNCPAASKIGTVSIQTPVLPANSLEGGVYLGKPASGPITGPPYTIYLDAESSRYGISVRLKGTVVADETTGRLTTTFAENPEAPFSSLSLHFKGGPFAPLANPLSCGAVTPEVSLTPYSGQPASFLSSPFTIDADGREGACASPLPFSLSQGTSSVPASAGTNTSFTFNVARADGQQYLSQISAVLPPGLLGRIPVVKLCEEAQANEGTCSAESQIGSVSVTVGSGPSPYTISGGAVFLTGPYNGAPYGLSIAVPAVAGPFNLGTVVTRATINVDPYTARLTIAGTVPTIVKGVPLRLRALSMTINHEGFMVNPTSCGPLQVETVLTSTQGASDYVSSPLQVGNCGALAFTPSFSASTEGNTSKANGASLQVNVSQGPNQSNIRSVTVQLPSQLPARLSTLQQACPETTFASNPSTCPAGSRVGSASVNTPVLPGALTGPAYLVSHGGAAFPDLDLVLEGDGVKAMLIGNTDIKAGIVSSTFQTLPDVPVASFTLSLPEGPNSALAANGNLCAGSSLSMPTTIVAQDGAQVTQSTQIAVSGCPGAGAVKGAASVSGVKILKHKIVGHTIVLEVQTFSAGRVSGKGANLKTVFRHLGKAEKATLKVSLSHGGLTALRNALHNGHRLKVRVRVGFLPKQRATTSSATALTVTFRR